MTCFIKIKLFDLSLNCLFDSSYHKSKNIICFIISVLGKEQILSKAMSSIPTDECGTKEARNQGCFQYLLCYLCYGFIPLIKVSKKASGSNVCM